MRKQTDRCEELVVNKKKSIHSKIKRKNENKIRNKQQYSAVTLGVHMSTVVSQCQTNQVAA